MSYLPTVLNRNIVYGYILKNGYTISGYCNAVNVSYVTLWKYLSFQPLSARSIYRIEIFAGITITSCFLDTLRQKKEF